MVNVSTRLGLMPALTFCKLIKLRIINPAPAKSTSESAISVTTSKLRSRPRPPPEPLRPPSFSVSFKSGLEASNIGAECCPDSDLFLASGRARKQQVRYVHTRNQQHERDYTEQNQKSLLVIADEVRSQIDHVDAHAFIGDGILGFDLRGDAGHLGLRLLNGYSRLQARD